MGGRQGGGAGTVCSAGGQGLGLQELSAEDMTELVHSLDGDLYVGLGGVSSWWSLSWAVCQDQTSVSYPGCPSGTCLRSGSPNFMILPGMKLCAHALAAFARFFLSQLCALSADMR